MSGCIYNIFIVLAPQFVQESMEQRRLELRGRPTLNMMIPMNVFEGSAKDHHGRGTGGESGDEALDEDTDGNKEVQVKVLVKRGNKQQQTKQMYITISHAIRHWCTVEYKTERSS